MIRYLLIALSCALLLASCSSGQHRPQQTQLELRQVQSRTFETPDNKMVMKAMLNVLQDEGFMVTQANLDLGLLAAHKEKDIENGWDAFWSNWPQRDERRWEKTLITECTANISEFGEQTRVRVTFQNKTLDNEGSVLKIRQVKDTQYYQDFFSKVSKGLFIEREKI